MKVDRLIVAAFLTASLALQAWTLHSVVELSSGLAALKQEVFDLHTHVAIK